MFPPQHQSFSRLFGLFALWQLQITLIISNSIEREIFLWQNGFFSIPGCILTTTQMETIGDFFPFFFFSFFFSWGLRLGWLQETGTLLTEGRKGNAIELPTRALRKLLILPTRSWEQTAKKASFPLLFSTLQDSVTPACTQQWEPD